MRPCNLRRGLSVWPYGRDLHTLTCSARSQPQLAQMYFGRSIQMSDSCSGSAACVPATGEDGGLERSAMIPRSNATALARDQGVTRAGGDQSNRSTQCGTQCMLQTVLWYPYSSVRKHSLGAIESR